MRLKPTPLVETSVVFSIAWLVSLVASVFWSGKFDAALTISSNIAIVYLLMSFTLWGITGVLVRKKSYFVRFFANLTVTSALAIGITLVLVDLTASAKGIESSILANAKETFVGMGVIYFVGSLIGALLTFFLVTRPKR